MEKWKKSVVHLKCFHSDDYISLGAGLFVKEETTRANKTKNIQYFIITAKHVVLDNSGKLYSYVGEINRYANAIEEQEVLMYKLDESLKDYRSHYEPVMLSKDDVTDLAAISLNSPVTEDFLKYLLRQGYEPIDISEFENSDVVEGDEILSIGFPNGSDIEMLLRNNTDNINSLPVFSFGKVAMNHQDLVFFLGDLSNHEGNSGGPVVKDNKVIGIVSSQPARKYRVLGSSNREIEIDIRYPLALIIKSKEVLRIIQHLKMNFWD